MSLRGTLRETKGNGGFSTAALLTKGLELSNGKKLLAQCAEQLLQEPEMEYLRNYIKNEHPDFIPLEMVMT